ncbi:thermonuclease family protein [Aneurinibacillus thermoaerophilus]|uniref:thermonuclease family protein n=1 Tax=Aneurinibacillus thermoaerophilus TaxID=143495 RepID=UPI002E228880|nr:thermonuclease family protein [Aneurinibacillus thermoaerophilus]
MFRPHDLVFLFWFLCFFAVAYWHLTNEPAKLQQGIPSDTVTAYVYKVTKDNTILAIIDGKSYTVRLQGIMISTTREARWFLKEKVTGQQVALEYDEQARDEKGNILAYVWLRGEMVNHTMVAKGYARAFQTPDQTMYIKVLKQAQK